MDPTELITRFISDPEVALLVISYGLAIVGFYKGLIVPKFIYENEKSRADKAITAAEKVTDALEALTTEIRQRRESR